MSPRRVDEAVESVPVMVIGEDPMTVNDEQDAEPEHEAVVVATLAKVLGPEKYGMLPMTADDDVERPLNEMAPVPLL